MVRLGQRITVVENRLDEEVELRVKVSPTHQVWEKFHIGSGKKAEFGATGFIYDDYNSHRYATIEIFLNGSDLGMFLMPRDFLTYAKIVIAKDANGKICISGLKSGLTDFGRIKGLGFIFGRNYGGKRTEYILSV